ncbi:pectinesterase family protein [Haloarcula mannanilytica]|uniref:pectinesterase family protein n=1 Tax=Haloarcula mannanilytica TaxID=2509225 RepID=UPI0010F8E85E|nr:pectinesterase family protein [Haloarcula mannanilytica]
MTRNQDGTDDSVHRPTACEIVVAKDGSGDYERVQAAIEAVPDQSPSETVICIEPGRYKEKLTLPETKTNVTFAGAGAAKTVLTYDDHADMIDEDGEEIGTTGSSTCFVNGDGFTARNLTFENDAPHVAQAVAIRVDADRAVFENCRFRGWQDTLYTYGEGTRQYYSECYIEGRVDFIFGWATAVFEDCEIRCIGDKGYVTAASTPTESDYGYVFLNCAVTGDAPPNSFYLGRPWRPHAKTVFMHCYLNEHIKPVGWHNWRDPANEETATYAEYENTGPGNNPTERVSWADQLTQAEATDHASLQTVFDGWNPRATLEDTDEHG